MLFFFLAPKNSGRLTKKERMVRAKSFKMLNRKLRRVIDEAVVLSIQPFEANTQV